MQKTLDRTAFTAEEIAYLESQGLGRLATVGRDGQPHVVPVAYRYNPETGTVDVGGHDGFARRKKWRDARQNPKVAIVIDDIASRTPWRVRGLEVRGQAEQLPAGGDSIRPGFDPEMIRIKPSRIISWGINPEERRK